MKCTVIGIRLFGEPLAIAQVTTIAGEARHDQLRIRAAAGKRRSFCDAADAEAFLRRERSGSAHHRRAARKSSSDRKTTAMSSDRAAP